MNDIVIKSSPIHGKGVFANRNFKQGEVVIDWSTCTTQLTQEEVDTLPEENRRYVSRLDDGQWVLFRSPGKYVNHSCESNTQAINGHDIAIRDIQKGEEITANYIAEKAPLPKTRCNCGSEHCLGFIGS